MLPAAIELAFDPVIRLAGLDIRWQAIGVSASIAVALAVAAAIASYLPDRRPEDELAEKRHYYPPPPVSADRDRLRLDDLAYIVLGSVPGAVIGGRLVHGVAFWEAYAVDPWRLLDPNVGSLSLLGAVLGGMIGAAYFCRLLGAPVRRWADAASMPLLLAVGLGKLAQLLGGSGQGAPFDDPWAVAFVGPGPWHSVEPAVPAHPAQVYEGLWALAGIVVLLGLAGPGRDFGRALAGRRWLAGPARRDGLLFGATLAWLLVGRMVVGFSWRDEPLLGPLNVEQAIALGLLMLLLLAGGVLGLRARRRAQRALLESRSIVSDDNELGEDER